MTSWFCVGLGYTQQVGMLANERKDAVLADRILRFCSVVRPMYHTVRCSEGFTYSIPGISLVEAASVV